MESKTVILDSCVLITFFFKNDYHRPKIKDIFESLKKQNITPTIHLLSIIETLTVLKSKTTLPELIHCQNILLDPHYFSFDNHFYFNPLDNSNSIFKKFPKLSIIDSLILDLALKTHSPLITFDTDLQKAYSTLSSPHQKS